MVTDHAVGLSVAQLVAVARGPLPMPLSLQIAMGVAQSLRSLNEQGEVHGAVRPDSVFVSTGGSVKLTGWLEPTELAPDGRQDVYGLGLVLFVMTTGQEPRPEISSPTRLGRFVEDLMPVAPVRRRPPSTGSLGAAGEMVRHAVGGRPWLRWIMWCTLLLMCLAGFTGGWLLQGQLSSTYGPSGPPPTRQEPPPGDEPPGPYCTTVEAIMWNATVAVVPL